MIKRKGEARWCTGDKKHLTISHLRGCNCNDGSHSDVGGQEEAGRRAGQQQGGGRLQLRSLRRLDAANVRVKEAAQRSQRRTHLMRSSFLDKPRQGQVLGDGGGGRRVMAVNRGVGSGRQRAMADTDKAISNQREVIIFE